MNIIIPVSYNGKQGIVEITLLPNGNRSIRIDIDGSKLDLIQNGEAKSFYSLTGTIQGKLYKVLEERNVGIKKWRVRDFILSVDTIRGEQKRLLQASGSLVDEICTIGHGSPIICETNFLGKEFKRGEEYVYRNLDEVSKIHTI